MLQAYASVWDVDLAAKDIIKSGENPSWVWFDEKPQISEVDKQHMMGSAPHACLFLSHNALDRISQSATVKPVFCELRVATTANRLGFKPTPFNSKLRQTINWVEKPYDLSTAGVYHPVKTAELPRMKLPAPQG
ncbi:MAG: hypothetical protein ACI8P9_002234 [Parasphingorhabdus sp.]